VAIGRSPPPALPSLRKLPLPRACRVPLPSLGGAGPAGPERTARGRFLLRAWQIFDNVTGVRGVDRIELDARLPESKSTRVVQPVAHLDPIPRIAVGITTTSRCSANGAIYSIPGRASSADPAHPAPAPGPGRPVLGELPFLVIRTLRLFVRCRAPSRSFSASCCHCRAASCCPARL
jgi:hypothetical protein